jgi:nicotinamide-nucleotide amidase
MAEGALQHSPADLAVAVTGIAGPGGATPAKPVGLVWLALAQRGAATHAEALRLSGDRASVRSGTVEVALERVLQRAAKVQ